MKLWSIISVSFQAPRLMVHPSSRPGSQEKDKVRQNQTLWVPPLCIAYVVHENHYHEELVQSYQKWVVVQTLTLALWLARDPEWDVCCLYLYIFNCVLIATCFQLRRAKEQCLCSNSHVFSVEKGKGTVPGVEQKEEAAKAEGFYTDVLIEAPKTVSSRRCVRVMAWQVTNWQYYNIHYAYNYHWLMLIK